MRLIDADAFKEMIGTDTKIRKMVCDVIDTQPTAYNLDAVVEELEKQWNNAICIDDDMFYLGIANGLADAIEIVNQLAEEYKSGWISVSEKLPEESLNSVIGWDEYRNRCCFVQYYGGRWVLGNDIDSVKIIAWQPLPEPYKGE